MFRSSHYSKLPESEKEQRYLQTYEENLELKQRHNSLENELKKMAHKIKVVTEGKAGGVELDDILRENRQLKLKLHAFEATKNVRIPISYLM